LLLIRVYLSDFSVAKILVQKSLKSFIQFCVRVPSEEGRGGSFMRDSKYLTVQRHFR